MVRANRDFENDEPIDDLLVALDLLVERWGEHQTSREIDRRFKEDGPYVQVGHHSDFSVDRFYRFKVTDRICDALVGSGLAAGKPEWGYTDMKRLRATDSGKARLFEERAKLGLRAGRWQDDRFQAFWWLLERA
jgi:hypothetical protein